MLLAYCRFPCMDQVFTVPPTLGLFGFLTLFKDNDVETRTLAETSR